MFWDLTILEFIYLAVVFMFNFNKFCNVVYKIDRFLTLVLFRPFSRLLVYCRSAGRRWYLHQIKLSCAL